MHPKPYRRTVVLGQAQSLDPKMSQYVPQDILQDSDINGAEHMDLNDLMVGVVHLSSDTQPSVMRYEGGVTD